MRGHLITSQYKVTAAVLSSLGGCLVRTATQSNDGRSGGGGDRVLAPSLNRGLSLICRSGDTGHWSPWSPPADVSRDPGTGHQARLPTAHPPIVTFADCPQLPHSSAGARLPCLPTCFYPFGHFHFVLNISLPMPYMYVKLWFF